MKVRTSLLFVCVLSLFGCNNQGPTRGAGGACTQGFLDEYNMLTRMEHGLDTLEMLSTRRLDHLQNSQNLCDSFGKHSGSCEASRNGFNVTVSASDHSSYCLRVKRELESWEEEIKVRDEELAQEAAEAEQKRLEEEARRKRKEEQRRAQEKRERQLTKEINALEEDLKLLGMGFYTTRESIYLARFVFDSLEASKKREKVIKEYRNKLKERNGYLDEDKVGLLERHLKNLDEARAGLKEAGKKYESARELRKRIQDVVPQLKALEEKLEKEGGLYIDLDKLTVEDAGEEAIELKDQVAALKAYVEASEKLLKQKNVQPGSESLSEALFAYYADALDEYLKDPKKARAGIKDKREFETFSRSIFEPEKEEAPRFGARRSWNTLSQDLEFHHSSPRTYALYQARKTMGEAIQKKEYFRIGNVALARQAMPFFNQRLLSVRLDDELSALEEQGLYFEFFELSDATGTKELVVFQNDGFDIDDVDLEEAKLAAKAYVDIAKEIIQHPSIKEMSFEVDELKRQVELLKDIVEAGTTKQEFVESMFRSTFAAYDEQAKSRRKVLAGSHGLSWISVEGKVQLDSDAHSKFIRANPEYRQDPKDVVEKLEAIYSSQASLIEILEIVGETETEPYGSSEAGAVRESVREYGERLFDTLYPGDKEQNPFRKKN